MGAGICFLPVFALVCAFFVPGRGWWLAAALSVGAVGVVAVRCGQALARERRYRHRRTAGSASR
jgi:hypothetical protein